MEVQGLMTGPSYMSRGGPYLWRGVRTHPLAGGKYEILVQAKYKGKFFFGRFVPCTGGGGLPDPLSFAGSGPHLARHQSLGEGSD